MQLLQRSDSFVNTINLPVIVSISQAASDATVAYRNLHQLAGKPRISQPNGETPAGEGRNSRLAGESDIIQVWASMLL